MPKYSLMDSEIQARLRAIPGNDRWDLVSFTGSFEKAPASILLQLLNTIDNDYQVHWLKWSEQFPKKADVFWPAVHDLVVLDLYEYLPSLFELALTQVSPKELDQRIQSLVHFILESETDRLAQSSDTSIQTALQEIAARYRITSSESGVQAEVESF